MPAQLYHPALRALAALVILFAAWWNVHDARRIDLAVLQDRAEITVPLDSQHPLLQSFVPQANHLTALELNVRILRAPQDKNATLSLHLRRDRPDAPDLAQTRISLGSLENDPQFTFSFAPEPASRAGTYFLLMETDAEADAIAVWASSDNALDEGVLVANGQSTEQDLTLRAYDEIEPSEMLSEFGEHTNEFIFLLALTVTFAIVGMGLTALFNLDPDGEFAGRFITSLFIGIALVMALYALCAVFNLTLTPFVLRVMASISLGLSCLILLKSSGRSLFDRAMVLASLRERRIGKPTPVRHSSRMPLVSQNTLILAVLFMFALAIRVLQIANIKAPLWVDGLIHENLVETILASGGIPGGTLYHVGLHTLVAFLVSITDFPTPRMLLLAGAWASALCGLSLYTLAKKLFADNFTALVSASIVWFFAPFPSYLITWSRLPFLLGLAFLPLAIRLALDVPGRSRFILAALVVVGLLLSHIGTFSLWAVFLVIYLIANRTVAARSLLDIVLIALPALVLAAARLVPQLSDPRTGGLISSSRTVAEQIDPAYLFQVTLRFGGMWVWGVGIVGALVALFLDRKILWLLLGWFAAEYLLGRVQSVFFGELLANTTNWIIALCIPLALLAGVLAKWLRANAQSRNIHQIIPIGYLLILAFLGGRNLVGIVNPSTLLFTPADAQAMEWIRLNTPRSAKFLVNSFYWGEARYLPADGGGWLPAFTRRAVKYPRTAEEAKNIRDLIRDGHIEYIYLGRGKGVLERALFNSTKEFGLVYDRDGARVYQVLEPN